MKFVKSPKTGKLVGFVSRTKDNILKGVREESVYRKRICILSEELEGVVLPDTLYDVELKRIRGHIRRPGTLQRYR